MLEQERKFAIDVVHAAVRITRSVQGEIAPGKKDKDDRSPVTVADLAVQAVVSAALRERFSNDPLMAEESSEELRRPEWAELLANVTSHVQQIRPECADGNTVLDWIEHGQGTIDPARRYWVLDPVDGTKGFLRKEQYAIALALVERGTILLGVLACPNLPHNLAAGAKPGEGLGQLYVAVKEQGAERIDLGAGDVLKSSQSLRVSAESEPAKAHWVERVESSDKNHDVTAQVVERTGITNDPQRLDSQAKYAVVARGEAALYLRHSLSQTYREKVWDHAAGVIVTEEAGGRVTDVNGKPLDFSIGRQLDGNSGIVATNGKLHERVLAAVRDVMTSHRK